MQNAAEILERISDAFVSLDRDSRYSYVNRKAGELFGADPADLIGKDIWTAFPEGAAQPFRRAYERALREQTPVTVESYYEPWGRWFENRIDPDSRGISIFFTEITKRKRAEAALRESEERYRTLFEHSLDAVYAIDSEGYFTQGNEACARLTGYPLEEFLRMSFVPMIAPEDRERMVGYFRGGDSRGASPTTSTISSPRSRGMLSCSWRISPRSTPSARTSRRSTARPTAPLVSPASSWPSAGSRCSTRGSST